MDTLIQTKLSKSEWESIETKIPSDELRILQLIHEGYDNVNIKENNTQNMVRFTKLDMSADMQHHIYNKYFQMTVNEIKDKYCKAKMWKNIKTMDSKATKLKKLKSIEALRIQNVDSMIMIEKDNILEFILLEFTKQMCRDIKKETGKYPYYYYTLKRCIQICHSGTIPNTNPYVLEFIDMVLKDTEPIVKPEYVLSLASTIFEKNKWLHQFQDIQLFNHQKELFTTCKMHMEQPKLILYIAPTGTGKTLSPIGLCNGSRIIFVCVARHVGLALAKSAINVDKKVAFAFGCETASDIRLHYFSAVDYEVSKKSGKICKVDNSNGSKVEIMICDIQSYLVAMYYMLAFNEAQNIITYWDEPTITMDYETHELHEQIHKNWSKNKIPNMILSCATLPKEHEIQDVLQDFRIYFEGAMIHSIVSNEYKKTIPIIDSDSYAFVPHTHYHNFTDVRKVAQYCTENKTLLRYFDLEESMYFVKALHFIHAKLSKEEEPIISERYVLSNYFQDIMQMNMSTLKEYYLILLNSFSETYWERIQDICKKFKKEKYCTMSVHATGGGDLRRTQSVQDTSTKNGEEIRRNASDSVVSSNASHYEKDTLKGCRLTTIDAHTLTDGPTIYLVENVSNIAKFCIYQSNIPTILMDSLLETIERNNTLQHQIHQMEIQLEKHLEVKNNEDTKCEGEEKKHMKSGKKKEKDKDVSTNVFADGLQQNIRQLQNQIVPLTIPYEYIPNTVQHQEIWTVHKKQVPNAFNVYIEPSIVKEVMSLNVDNHYKFLVMMGIGVLEKSKDKKYEELVKRLAQQQQLYLIITSSDYIYGTNYQFCHGFIGKDLQNMTQQKLIQSMGRIGRNNIQQTFSVRFRDNTMIDKLFRHPEVNIEAENMVKLFCTDEDVD